LLEDKKEILSKNIFLNNRKKARFLDRYEKSKRFIFFIGIILGFGLIVFTYLISDASKIYSISVEGNYYLSDEDIIEYSKLNSDNIYLFINNSRIEKQILNSNNLLSNCKLEKLDNNLIKINISEKKIVGYGYDENEDCLFLENGETIKLDSSNINLIAFVPMIEGFSKEDLILVNNNLAKLDSELINEISEIHYYPDLKYQNVEVIMRDGNYVFTNVYGLKILNNYYDIESSIDMNENRCFYFEDISGNAYTMACPWVKETDTSIIDETIE